MVEIPFLVRVVIVSCRRVHIAKSPFHCANRDAPSQGFAGCLAPLDCAVRGPHASTSFAPRGHALTPEFELLCLSRASYNDSKPSAVGYALRL